MEILVLASGSSGNAALVTSGGTSLLVDVGVSALQVRNRLEVFGRTPDEIDAVLLTHEHSDHVRGLEVFLRRHRQAPVWTTRGTWSGIDVRSDSGGELESGTTLSIGNISITPVSTSHDAAEPVAYVFDDGDRCAALCTDTGTFTKLLAQRLQGCELLLLETNHDKDMLRHGPYPWPLKQRIDSSTGHLSNHQSCEAVDKLKSSVLRAVIGMHLSAENNCPIMVCDELRATVGNGTDVAAVTRSEMLKVVLDRSGVQLERCDLPPSQPVKG
jgi:phosphoribosyl 1,2-cyclic phosphodiesterase